MSCVAVRWKKMWKNFFAIFFPFILNNIAPNDMTNKIIRHWQTRYNLCSFQKKKKIVCSPRFIFTSEWKIFRFFFGSRSASMFSWLIVKFSVWLRKLDRDSVECAINQLDMRDCDDVIIFVEWIAHTDWGKSSGIFRNFSCSSGFIQLTHWTLNSHRIEISSRVHCTLFDFIESLIHNLYYFAIFNLFLFHTTYHFVQNFY